MTAPISPRGGAGGPLTLDGWDLVLIGGEALPGIATVRASVGVKCDSKIAAGVDGAKPTHHGLEPKPIEIDVEVWTDEQIAELARIYAKILPQPGPKPASKGTKPTSYVGFPPGFVGPPAPGVQFVAPPGFTGPLPSGYAISQADATAAQNKAKAAAKKAAPRPPSIIHPSLDVLGYVTHILVEGATNLMPTGQRGRYRSTIHGKHWLVPKAGATVTPKSPTRDVKNVRDASTTNPTPASQASTYTPPSPVR